MGVDPLATNPSPVPPTLKPSQPTQPVSRTPTPLANIPTPTLIPTKETAPQSTPVSSPTSTKDNLPRSVYSMTVEIDYQQHRVFVEQNLTYFNPTDQPLNELLLVVDANRTEGVFQMGKFEWAGGEPIKEYAQEGTHIRMQLPEALAPQEPVNLFIEYQLNLPARSNALGYTPFQINLLDWYPYIPPIHPKKGWFAHKPWAYGEYLVYDVADFDVSIKVDGDSESHPDQTFLIVTGAPGTWQDDRTRYHLRAARSFAIAISPNLQVSSQEIDGIAVSSYYYREHRPAGEAALRAVSDALMLYSQLFGPYQRESLSVVEASFGDGKEYDGLIFVSQGFYADYDLTPKNYLTILSAHETAHQWWFSQVGNDQALEPWLDEALTTFSELLFYEHYYPEQVDWWWFFRVNLYSPMGWVDGTIYDYPGFRPYVNATYLRGAQFLVELREVLGEEALLQLLREYAARYSYQQATGDDFFGLLASTRELDTSTLLENFFQSPPTPRE